MNGTDVVGGGARRVIALHGWFGHAGAWGPLVDAIDPARYSYAFMDYRGYGRSKAVSGRFTVDEIAGDALALADRLGWERFSVVGHSMGGMAALRTLVEAPERVERVVGINPIPASGYPFDEAGWAFFSQAADSAEVRHAILDLTTGRRLSPYFIGRLTASSLESSTVEAFRAYLTLWGRGDFHERLSGLDHPIHLIVGEHDPAVTVGLLEGTARKLGVATERMVMTLDRHGNTSAASVPLAFDAAVKDGRIKRGNLILMEAMGGGFTWGAVLARY
jgi:pimeloyl-ACP methyl ester carboxylesterase